MEGQRRKDQEGLEQEGRGRAAESPAQIPKKGWKDILLRTKEEVSRDNVAIIAAGVAFFLLLGLVPGLAAFISIYGLVAEPSDIREQFAAISHLLPREARELLQDQMERLASADKTAGIAAVVSIVLALWGGSAAMKTMMNALNIIYGEKEKRGYFKLTLVALALTLTFVAIGLIALGMIVVLPPLLESIGLGGAAKITVSLLRWPLLLLVALVGLAVLYRYAPSRAHPTMRWISPGAMVATILWVAGSALFSFYAANFGKYNETYGSLGAVVVMMLWLYISAFAVLLGAEINSETEHQTAKDTTTGPPEPMGRRGAYVADTLGESKAK